MDMSKAYSHLVLASGEFHSSHAHYKSAGRGFVIQHYAGPVEYNKDAVCNANKDALIHDLLCVVKASTNKFMQALFPEPLDEDKKKQPTLGSKMKDQVMILIYRYLFHASSSRIQKCALLVEALMLCNPHYVRCIKPNDEKKPLLVDCTRVIHQIKYLGLLGMPISLVHFAANTHTLFLHTPLLHPCSHLSPLQTPK